MKTLQRNAGNANLKYLARTLTRDANPQPRRLAVLALFIAALAMTSACSHAMMMLHGTGARRPAVTEFGLGPRSSANGLYVATLEAEGQLRVRRMQTVRVAIADRDGRAVEGATLAIAGGMPEHGHGLPTRPRVTQAIGAGTYVVEGVRFNMGGWWEFKVSITSARGADSVTFNLSL